MEGKERKRRNGGEEERGKKKVRGGGQEGKEVEGKWKMIISHHHDFEKRMNSYTHRES